jgi:hypothetical protein
MAVNNMVFGSGTDLAVILSTPSVPTMETASVGVGLSMILNAVVLLRAAVALPKIAVKLEGVI